MSADASSRGARADRLVSASGRRLTRRLGVLFGLGVVLVGLILAPAISRSNARLRRVEAEQRGCALAGGTWLPAPVRAADGADTRCIRTPEAIPPRWN